MFADSDTRVEVRMRMQERNIGVAVPPTGVRSVNSIGVPTGTVNTNWCAIGQEHLLLPGYPEKGAQKRRSSSSSRVSAEAQKH